MKINWKRVVIGAIWAELLLMAIYFPAKMYSVPAFPAIAILAEFPGARVRASGVSDRRRRRKD